MQWSTDLNSKEISVLLAFIDHNPIVYPIDCGLSKNDVAKVINSLRRKNIIKESRAPLSLTKKGQRYLKSLKIANRQY